MPPSRPTFISEVTIPAKHVREDGHDKDEPPRHSYRGLTSANAERFAYLRQVSEGRHYGSSSNSKLSDPGPRSVMTQVQHQRSHSDGESSAGAQPPKPPVAARAAKPAPPARAKRPEELECDQLSRDLINHLLPSDSRLHALLSAPDPGQTTANLRTEGLLEVVPPSETVAPQSPRSPPPPSSSPSLSPNK